MNARRAAGGAAALLVVMVAPGSVAGASTLTGAPTVPESGVDVVNTETVQVYLDSAGDVQEQRIYEQMVLRGNGEVKVVNPVATEGLRDLDGFGSPQVDDGAHVATYDVEDVLRTRTVSDYTGELPLDVSVEYLLDGEEVDPEDVVGASGLLETRYTIENTTTEVQQLEVPDGKGGVVVKELEVAVPFAGSLELTLPEQFTDVTSERGVLAGDGRGGTKVAFTLTLFPPIGATTTTVGWSAEITDGVIPRAELMALPVNPMRSATFATATKGYAKGQDSGVQLAEGALEMDANLLKLRSGAEDLLGGLLQLYAGADELRTGLAGKALTGANALAEGSGKLDDGLALLDDGATRLSDGAGTLHAGTGDAATGSRDLRDGLARISDGLGKLADVDGLPAAAEGVTALQTGVDQLLAGFGAAGTPGTLLDGLTRLETGLGNLSAGLTQLKGDGTPQQPGLVGAKGGVDQVRSGLTSAIGAGGSLDLLVQALNLLKTLDCGPTCASVIDSQILPGVEASRTQLTGARDGLVMVSGGLGQAITGLEQQLIPGAQTAAGGATAAKNGATALKTGLSEVADGLDLLEVGLTKAVLGVMTLDGGAADAWAGAGDLADGLGKIDAGAGELSTGAGDLAAGAGDAHDGSGLLADGAGELATGLLDAAQGSGLLADGLGEAAGGAPQLVDGAGRLSKEGAQVIAGKGITAAVDYGSLVAVMEAGGERADAEAMAYGAPDGAAGLTAYSFVIQGEDGAEGRNWTGAATGAVLLGLGGGAFLLRRRLAGV